MDLTSSIKFMETGVEVVNIHCIMLQITFIKVVYERSPWMSKFKDSRIPFVELGLVELESLKY